MVAPVPSATYIRHRTPDTSVRGGTDGEFMRTSRLGRWARWGWLATTFAMGAALLATAWTSRTRVVRAASTLNRGQAGVLLESARQLVRELPSPINATQLDSLLRLREDAGLRYVGVFDFSGTPIAEAGTPLGTVHLEHGHFDMGPPGSVEVGSRIRITGPAPPPRGAFDRERRPPRRYLAVEFEPVVAEQMAADSTSTLLLSVLVGFALLAAAFVFWRLSAQQELAERRLEEQRRLSALGEMAGVMAHEIRNPLASLKGHAQLLAERLRSGNESERRKADRVVHEAERLEALTTDLLDFVRSGPIDIQPADPVALVTACVDEVGVDDFTVNTADAPPSWPFDPARMRQALTNVLRNAQQATASGTRPEVSVHPRDGALEIVVRDFGNGIPAGDEEKIFTPFYTTRTTGTGLGLAVAQRVTQLHGGTITAANHEGGGAVFRITLPAG
jgi:two-component system, NtrC family, sensor histidine kinase HydH